MRKYQRNPRQITDKQNKALLASLDEFGDLGGVVHDLNSDEVAGGNQRARLFDVFGKTIEQLKADSDLVIVKEWPEPDRQGTIAHGFIVWRGAWYSYRAVRWTPEQCQRANLQANVLGGSWDWDLLAGFNADVLQGSGFDADLLADWGKDVAGLNSLLESEKPPTPDAPEAQMDRAEELRQKWGVESGQLWEIPSRTAQGVHRVVCGDCTDRAVVERVMEGERASLVVTDPPYGVAYADKNKFLNAISRANRVETPIVSDHLDKKQTQALWKAAFAQMSEIMLPGAVVYCFMPQGGDQMMMMMMMMMAGAGIEPRHELIWLKNNHVLGRVDYAYKHEPILYAWKEGGHKFYGDFQTSILEFPKPQISDLHPTTKPVELVERLIGNSSQVGELVYDGFCGSGTALVACEGLRRQGRGIEIMPGYVAVCLQRLSDMGLEPRLVND